MAGILKEWTKNFIPFQGEKGTMSENRTTKVDPSIARYLALEGERRGYRRSYPVALSGGETTFGRVGHGPVDPLSAGGKVSASQQIQDALDSPHYAKVKDTINQFREQGMGERDLAKMEKYLFSYNVLPFTNIDRGFNILDEKKRELLKNRLSPTPAHLSWYYQGTGKLNKNEVPGGVAYGEPVRSKTSPTRGHAKVVTDIMRAMAREGNELGSYVRGL